MTGKSYYITTLADWQRHASRFANSHFVVLAASTSVAPTAEQGFSRATETLAEPATTLPKAVAEPSGAERQIGTPLGDTDATRILVLVEADEGVHLSLEDDAAFEPLPHPLAQKPISPAAQAALAPHGVAPGATTFDAAETLARVHPLLKPRVF